MLITAHHDFATKEFDNLQVQTVCKHQVVTSIIQMFFGGKAGASQRILLQNSMRNNVIRMYENAETNPRD